MKKIIAILGVSTVLFPLLISAQSISRQGIFDCNQNGAYSMSVGALSAIGGIYVPVNDAAVTLNTGTLVYKECILREVIDRMRESALSALLKQMNSSIQTGRQGSAMYVRKQGPEEVLVTDKEFTKSVFDGSLDVLNPALKPVVQRALAFGYKNGTRDKTSALKCAYKGDLKALENAAPGTFSFEALYALGDPACNPMGAYYAADTLYAAREAKALEYQRNQWNWGQGFYSVTDNNADPLDEQINTPASVVQQSYQQMLSSPVRQLESANDIGQMIGALYAGVTTQAISDAGGLSGLSTSIGGQPSYIDQVATQSAAGLRETVVNVALTNISTARTIEGQYKTNLAAIVAAVSGASISLRNVENQCWVDVVPKVQEYADANTISIRVATTTAFSQAVIDANLANAGNTSVQNLTTENNLIQRLDTLIAGISNTSSPSAQQVAIAQFSNLVSSRALHTPTQLQALISQRGTIEASVVDLLDKTRKRWVGLSPDENLSNTSWDGTVAATTVGWCNIRANTTTAQSWANVWKI